MMRAERDGRIREIQEKKPKVAAWNR